MKRIAAIATLFLLSLMLPIAVPAKEYYGGFTHAVYLESVVGTWCPNCRNDLPAVHEAAQKYSGSIHLVDFHVATPSLKDEWATEYAMQKLAEYKSDATPTHAYDAGYAVKLGAISEDKIEQTGRRPVHRVTLAILKRMTGATLSFEGSIKEEDGKPFNGKVVVIAIENGMKTGELIWNFVFRAYLLTKDVNLQGGQYALISGSWDIPSGMNSEKIQLIAVAFDSADLSDSGKPLPVQSVSDADSGTVIPEFGTVLAVAGIALSTGVFVFKRSCYRPGKEHKRYQ